MKHKFLHVGFNFRHSPAPTMESLKEVFDQATDWYRYSNSCWIIWTTGTPTSWFQALRPKLTDDDYMFICEFDPMTFKGWLPKGGVDWLAKNRE